MTAYTHVAFGTFIAIAFNYMDFPSIALISLGSLLPDLDSQHSMISRLLFPINRILMYFKVQHRGATHSFLMYAVLSFIAIKLNFNTMFLLLIGAQTHIFLDCLNKSGVPLFLPISEKSCILTSRKYRMKSGDKREVYLIVIFILLSYLFYSVNAQGGFRQLLLKHLNNYQFTYSQYLKTSDKVSYLQATVRERGSNQVKDRRFLVVSPTRRNQELVLYDLGDNKIYSSHEDIMILKGNLETTEKTWSHIKLGKVHELTRATDLVFQKTRDDVMQKKVGDYLIEDILYFGDIELE